MFKLIKSRKNIIIALSVIIALFICSFGAVHAFSANANQKIIPTIDNIDLEKLFTEVLLKMPYLGINPDYDESPDYWNKNPWKSFYNYSESSMNVFILKNGTEIETESQFYTLQSNNKMGFAKPIKSSTIKLSNGTEITAPGGTIIEVAVIKDSEHELKITIGNGTATSKQPDGTSFRIPKGTVIDGNGDIIS
jgi:hypothetical protein